jgi:peroxiredoxin Q/BCP
MKFPSLDLPDQEGKIRRLDEFKDREYLVVYFYPMDNTPGCTLEAREFTKHLDDFHRLGTEVLGVSTQSPESHVNFCSRHDLHLILLSDREKRLTKKLGILRRLTGTAKRTTYLIRPDGEIVKEWPNVKPAIHAKEILEYIENLK